MVLRQVTVGGFIPIIRDAPGFITPVFIDGSAYFIQDTSEDGEPIRLEIEIDDRIDLLREPLTLPIKNGPVYGFFVRRDLQMFGDKQHLASCFNDIESEFSSRADLQASIRAFIESAGKRFAIEHSQVASVVGPPGAPLGWTKEREERLRALWSEGLSASQIAKMLGGVTRNNVIGKVHRLGLAGRATPSRPARRLPAQIPKLEPLVLSSAVGVGVMELNASLCKFPIGDPNTSDFAFCGAPATMGPYCSAHAALAYQQSKPRSRVAASLSVPIAVSLGPDRG